MSKEDELLKEYLDKFGELPPNDEVISYYDDLYIKLIEDALKSGNKITPETLENAISNEPYDYVSESEEMEDFEEQENEDKGMDKNEQAKIRKLLQEYGADGKEIENFMRDLADYKEAVEEDEIKEDEDDFNYLDDDTMTKLKATEEGKDLIMNAPKMAKDELKKAIMEYLSK